MKHAAAISYAALFLAFPLAEYLICQRGWCGIPFKKGYYFKRYKHCLPNHKVIEDIQQISKDSIGCVMKYPIFYGQKVSNKIITIIYENKTNKPVGLHIIFDFNVTEDNGKKHHVVHGGVILISKQHQQRHLQSIIHANIILILLERLGRSYYITDVGRSASGLRLFNKAFPHSSFPNPTLTAKEQQAIMGTYGTLYRKICNKLMSEYREEFGCSKNAQFDPHSFIIKDSNEKEGGGAYYLLPHAKNQKSRSIVYSEFIENNFDTQDEYISIAHASLYNLLRSKL